MTVTTDSATQGRCLALNAGSSSLKAAVFAAADTEQALLRCSVERLGTAQARLSSTGPAAAQPAIDQPVGATPQAAIAAVFAAVERCGPVSAIGHRIVHAGFTLTDHQVVTDEALAQLRAAVAIDPTHLPLAIALIDACRQRYPGARQLLCLDSAFHRDLPHPARLLPLPRHLLERGLRRLGFHGLSFAYVLAEVERRHGAIVAAGRLVLAHLGSGASMAAVRGGRCLDTSMGPTAQSGLVMGTRSGDLDPGLVAYLLRSGLVAAADLDDFLTRECGLRGVSGRSADLRDLESAAGQDAAAADAIALFVLQARRWLGSLVLGLGGLDTLIFSGGIGEHDAGIRAALLAQLDFLGLGLDPDANRRHAAVISAPGSRVLVLVVRTDEEVAIARLIASRLPPASPQEPQP